MVGFIAFNWMYLALLWLLRLGLKEDCHVEYGNWYCMLDECGLWVQHSVFVVYSFNVVFCGMV